MFGLPFRLAKPAVVTAAHRQRRPLAHRLRPARPAPARRRRREVARAGDPRRGARRAGPARRRACDRASRPDLGAARGDAVSQRLAEPERPSTTSCSATRRATPCARSSTTPSATRAELENRIDAEPEAAEQLPRAGGRLPRERPAVEGATRASSRWTRCSSISCARSATRFPGDSAAAALQNVTTRSKPTVRGWPGKLIVMLREPRGVERVVLVDLVFEVADPARQLDVAGRRAIGEPQVVEVVGLLPDRVLGQRRPGRSDRSSRGPRSGRRRRRRSS